MNYAMNTQKHFELMSAYNMRMNQQINHAIKNLTDIELNEDKGAFFHSIVGTLNHILVGDIIWLSRFAQFSARYVSLIKISSIAKPTTLDQILFSNKNTFIEAREKVDSLLCDWLQYETIESDFNQMLCYKTTKDIDSRRDFGELINHLFNHQTHHRGQLTTLLNQMKLEVGTTDFLIEIPES